MLGRVDAAKAKTDLALETINNNMDDVDEALETLRGMGDLFLLTPTLWVTKLMKLVFRLYKGFILTNSASVSLCKFPYNTVITPLITV